jgi:SET domain-containing protein
MKDLHERWPHRWLTSKARPGNSNIHRYGIFAVEKITKGEPINVFGGIAVPKSEIEEYRDIISHAGIQVSDDFFIVPSSNEEIKEQGIFNHSCEPNVGFNSSVTMIAIQDIESEEELLMNYAFMETYFEPFECNCGTEPCRKTIDSNTWKDEGFIEKYFDYYSPYLKEKLRITE